MLRRGRAGEHTGYVLDGALGGEFMTALDGVRTALPIDKEKKKTAAARRFLCAEDELQWIRLGLVDAIAAGLARGANDEAVKEVRILPYMRFLEYSEPNGALGPHTDALIRCKETQVWSTHTLLVFCSDCEVGGETTLLPEDPKAVRIQNNNVLKARRVVEELQAAIARIGATTNNVDNAARLDRLHVALEAAQSRAVDLPPKPSFPVKPRRGRVFFFPHECPHEGRPTVSVPKIFLRAELIILRTSSGE